MIERMIRASTESVTGLVIISTISAIVPVSVSDRDPQPRADATDNASVATNRMYVRQPRRLLNKCMLLLQKK